MGKETLTCDSPCRGDWNFLGITKIMLLYVGLNVLRVVAAGGERDCQFGWQGAGERRDLKCCCSPHHRNSQVTQNPCFSFFSYPQVHSHSLFSNVRGIGKPLATVPSTTGGVPFTCMRPNPDPVAFTPHPKKPLLKPLRSCPRPCNHGCNQRHGTGLHKGCKGWALLETPQIPSHPGLWRCPATVPADSASGAAEAKQAEAGAWCKLQPAGTCRLGASKHTQGSAGTRHAGIAQHPQGCACILIPLQQAESSPTEELLVGSRPLFSEGDPGCLDTPFPMCQALPSTASIKELVQPWAGKLRGVRFMESLSAGVGPDYISQVVLLG